MMLLKLFFKRIDTRTVLNGRPFWQKTEGRMAGVTGWALRLLASLLLLLSFTSAHLHEYHASVTNMHYNATERVFEVSVRLFTDDLERALAADNGGQRVKLEGVNAKKNDPLIEKYLRKHFMVATPQKQRKVFSYVGHETEVDAQWVYLELPYTETFRGGVMQQSVLMDLFEDQVNLVTINYNAQKKTFLFRKNQSIQEISF